ncbi:hypothetical protein IscW_ISCW024912, partial [Ixodes scapularis]
MGVCGPRVSTRRQPPCASRQRGAAQVPARRVHLHGSRGRRRPEPQVARVRDLSRRRNDGGHLLLRGGAVATRRRAGRGTERSGGRGGGSGLRPAARSLQGWLRGLDQSGTGGPVHVPLPSRRVQVPGGASHTVH